MTGEHCNEYANTRGDQMMDKENFCTEFKKEFSGFTSQLSNTITVIKPDSELVLLFTHSAEAVRKNIFEECNKKITIPHNFSVAGFLLSEMKFYNDFDRLFEFENDASRRYKLIEAGIVIFESISKFFAGTTVELFSDISIELLKLITSFYL